MRRPVALLTALLLAVGLLLPTTSATAAPDGRAERVVRTIPANDDLVEAGRILGRAGRGIHVFWQIRDCGKGRWQNLSRVTTNGRGIYRFDLDDRVLRRRFELRTYRPRWTETTQFGVLIPATGTFRAVRIADTHCLG